MDSNLSYSCQTGRHDILQQKGNVMFIILLLLVLPVIRVYIEKNKYYSETYAFHFINVWREKKLKRVDYIAVKVLVRSNLTFTSQK